MDRLFAAWREDLATRRKFAPAARNYAAARLMAEVGLWINEARRLDLDDIRCLDLDDVRLDLGWFGKLHVRHGKGARGSGPRGADGAPDQRGRADAAGDLTIHSAGRPSGH